MHSIRKLKTFCVPLFKSLRLTLIYVIYNGFNALTPLVVLTLNQPLTKVSLIMLFSNRCRYNGRINVVKMIKAEAGHQRCSEETLL